MKIVGWTLHPLHIPYRHPIHWSDVAEDGATLLLLRLRTDEGAEGVAEATVKPTWSGTSLRSLGASLDDLFLPQLLGRDPTAMPDTRALYARIPENQIAKGLVSNALWDLRAAITGKPLWQHWGGDRTTPASWTVTRAPPGAMARDAERAVARHGFATLKIKGGQGRAADVEAIRAIRSVIPDTTKLYVDANSAYPAVDALDYVKALAAEGIALVEDPMMLAPDEAFERLARESPLPVIVDWRCLTSNDAQLFIQRGACNVSVKPGRAGLDEAWQTASIARARSAVHVGLFGESDLGSLCAMQLAASLPERADALPAESTLYLAMANGLLAQPLVILSGSITFPEMAGAASMLDWDAVRRLRAD